MRYLVFAALVAAALLAQLTLSNYIQVWGVKPDLLMVLVILNGFLRGTREGAFLGFMAGLMKDLLAGCLFGTGALSGLIAGYAAGFAEARLFKESRLIGAGLVFCVSILVQLVLYATLSLSGLGLAPGVALFKIALPAAAYNGLVGAILYGRYYRSVQQGLLSQDARML